MANECFVLGLGETLSQFNRLGTTIGVNDVSHKLGLQLDYLVLQDNPTNFSFERYQRIIDNPPKTKVFTNQFEWQKCFGNVTVEINNFKMLSIDSTFFALKMAYALGFTTINLFGVDFTNHPQHSQKLNIILANYNKLFEFLAAKNIKVNIPKASALSSCKNITVIG
jgi:hypothetical protein